MRLCADISSDDIVYCTLPLYHTNGGVLSAGQMLFTGATLVIRKKFSASNFWQDCIKYKCTVSYIIICIKNLSHFPSVFFSFSLHPLSLKVTFYIGELCRYLLAQPNQQTDTQHNIRLCIGNGLRPQIWTAFTKRFGIPNIYEFYGCTEGSVGLINPFNKPGACGFSLKILSMLNEEILIKVIIIFVIILLNKGQKPWN